MRTTAHPVSRLQQQEAGLAKGNAPPSSSPAEGILTSLLRAIASTILSARLSISSPITTRNPRPVCKRMRFSISTICELLQFPENVTTRAPRTRMLTRRYTPTSNSISPPQLPPCYYLLRVRAHPSRCLRHENDRPLNRARRLAGHLCCILVPRPLELPALFLS